MAQSISEFMDSALALPEADRAELAKRLTASLTTAPSGLHPAWAGELRRRTAEIDSGAVKPIPWSEVSRRMQLLLDSGGTANG
jgi:putative addiction module component (TIGR02574 family)